MKIRVDLTGFDSIYSGGVSTFAMGLTRGLVQAGLGHDRISVLVTEHNRADIADNLRGGEIDLLEVPDEWYGHRYLRGVTGYLGAAIGTFKLPYYYDLAFRSRRAAKINNDCDVIIVPTTTFSLTSHCVPTILCVHDIQHEYHPEFFSRRELIVRRSRYRLSCWAASAVQASSDFVRQCLIEKFSFLDPSKIFVAPEGVDFGKFDPAAPTQSPGAIAEKEAGRFLFYPAQLWPHKNHLLLIEALAAFRARYGYEVPCILTGQDYGMGQTIADAIAHHQLGAVHYLGRVPFTQLLWLYANCRAVMALGLHESSSLPLREGAVFGKPLICSDIPPNRELDGMLSLLSFEQNSAASLLEVIERLLAGQVELAAQAADNAKVIHQFAWRLVAQKYLDICAGLVARQKLPRS